MADYRRSYQKTVLTASLVGVGGVASLIGVGVGIFTRKGAWGPGGWLEWGAVAAMLIVGTGCAVLVVCGGLIALRRDALEALGVPYASREPREWVPGSAIGALRRAIRLLRRALQPSTGSLDLRPGEPVEVRSLPEILATLDERGTLDGLPFMPEMSAYCGKRYRVLRRVDKINDWIRYTGLRRLRDTVLLEHLRCDGKHHGGCQASCHLRWKEAWLRRPAAAPGAPPGAVAGTALSDRRGGRLPLVEGDLHRLARRSDESGQEFYTCQITQLTAGTTPLRWGDPRHYLRDLVQGNVRPGPWLVGISLALFNWVQRARGGVGYPNYWRGERTVTPHEALALKPGEVVRVRSKREIEETLARSRNRGLWFDGEMLRFCGGEYRVLARVDRVIQETTGTLVHLTNPCITLDGVTASGEYLAFCAQNEAIMWREIWLERVPSDRASP